MVRDFIGLDPPSLALSLIVGAVGIALVWWGWKRWPRGKE